jgi:adenine deaminase
VKTILPGVVAGFALHDELEALVSAGVTPYQALDAATRAPTAWMGVADDRGTIAIGKRADLLLLDADPLADVANTNRIAGVVVSGRWLSRRELDARLDELQHRYAASPRPCAVPGMSANARREVMRPFEARQVSSLSAACTHHPRPDRLDNRV